MSGLQPTPAEDTVAEPLPVNRAVLPDSRAYILPIRCSGCPVSGANWDTNGQCLRCGLARDEVAVFWHEARHAYDSAKSAAASGNWLEMDAQLERATQSGLPAEIAPVTALQNMARAAQGDWNALSTSQLPEPWHDSALTARQHYERGLLLARAGDWRAALVSADAAVEAAPWLEPAQSLRAIVTQAIALSTPPEPIPRDDLPSPELPLPIPREAPVPTSPIWQRVVPTVLSAVAAGLALTAALRSGSEARRENSTPVNAGVKQEAAPKVVTERRSVGKKPSQPESVSVVNTAKKSVKPELPKPLRRQLSEHELELARRWFNEAVDARRGGRYAQAERLADAVFAIAPNSYLGDEALLLRAQAADNRNSPDSHELYADIARLAPSSRYAPVGLYLAAQEARARKLPREVAEGYERKLRERYPRSKEATRLASRESIERMGTTGSNKQ